MCIMWRSTADGNTARVRREQCLTSLSSACLESNSFQAIWMAKSFVIERGTPPLPPLLHHPLFLPFFCLSPWPSSVCLSVLLPLCPSLSGPLWSACLSLSACLTASLCVLYIWFSVCLLTVCLYVCLPLPGPLLLSLEMEGLNRHSHRLVTYM